jgi:hypothetical protein
MVLYQREQCEQACYRKDIVTITCIFTAHELAGLIQLRTELDCTASTIFPTSVEVWMNNEVKRLIYHSFALRSLTIDI